ncbi:OmpW/AlkL family protein [Actomonas aquatica]|uniref:OmpW family outer membrane protein n=1 Tax=Actomonas aquatica TaxID=2866162 RepID=A0ABZ1C4F2_9BACT|nr:OmpW family outer membrane protein [Opitutus sp. WL0086]WRQ86326.1 OmpW family outer membrane protein [Opitutus sp. WL0086]
MNFSRLALGALALGLATASSVFAAGPWSVRLRATYLETVDQSPAFSALGINFADDAVIVSDKFIPEIDIDYAFNDVLSAELVLTIPQKHRVDLAGVGRLGSFKHLPPTLLLQYHPKVSDTFQPYLGVGVNFTLIFDDNLVVAGVPLALEDYSVGLAAQAGFDVRVNDRWSFNVDVKRAAIRSDVLAGAAKLTTAKLDPWLYAVGMKYDF